MTWKKLVAFSNSPSARTRHTAVTLGCHMIVYGGWKGHAHSNAPYVFNLNTWLWSKLEIDNIGPEARSGHTATVVGEREIVIFGGIGANSRHFCDIHVIYVSEWNEQAIVKSEWIQPSTSGKKPLPRAYHTACLLENNIIVFGGENSTGNVFFNDVYIL
eukprot:Colp12_sorted_trinity150504_noHs@19933